MIGLHLSISALRWARNAAGVARFSAIGSVPNSPKRCFTLSSFNATWRALVSLSIAGFGVAFGAYRPCQTETSKPFTPASSMVGTLGSEATRFLVVTPYTLIFSALIWLVVFVVWSHIKSTWPPRRSFIAGAVPLYGMVSRSVWIALMKSIPHRCDAAPIPAFA